MEGIEFVVEIQDRLEGAVAASAALKKLYADAEKADHGVGGVEAAMRKAGVASRGATGAHNEHGTALLKLGHHFEELTGSVRMAAHEMGALLAFEAAEKGIEVLERVVDKLVEVGVEGIKAAAATERAEKALSFSLGEGPGKALVEWTERIKSSTEFTGDQLRGFEAQLARVGMTVPQIQRTIASSMDVAAISGDPIRGMEGAIEAFERLQRTGKVENRMLAGLGFGEKDFGRLTKFAHLTKTELQKQMESGSVTLGDVEELIFKRTGKALGGLGVEMSKTMGAAIRHFGEKREDLFEGLANSPSYARLTRMILDLNERLDPSGPLGSKLFVNIEKGLTSVVNAMAKVDMEKFSKDVINLFSTLPPLIEMTTKALTLLGKVAHFVTDNLVITPASIEAHKNDKVSAPVDFMARMLDKAFPNVKKSLVGEQAVDGIAKGMDAAIPRAEASTFRMTGAIESAARGPKGFDEHSPSLKFMRIGTLAGEGLALGLGKSMDDALEASYKVLDDGMDVPALSTKAASMFRTVGAGAAGGSPISVNTHVSVQVEKPDATADEIAEAVRIEVPSAILAALEQIGLQGGQS